jgi:hypothetical protein
VNGVGGVWLREKGFLWWLGGKICTTEQATSIFIWVT